MSILSLLNKTIQDTLGCGFVTEYRCKTKISVGIIGTMSSGKSTLVDVIKNSHKTWSVEGNVFSDTRLRPIQITIISSNNVSYGLYEVPSLDGELCEYTREYFRNVRDSFDLILCVFDKTHLYGNSTKEILDLLHSYEENTIIIINKCDSPDETDKTKEPKESKEPNIIPLEFKYVIQTSLLNMVRNRENSGYSELSGTIANVTSKIVNYQYDLEECKNKLATITGDLNDWIYNTVDIYHDLKKNKLTKERDLSFVRIHLMNKLEKVILQNKKILEEFAKIQRYTEIQVVMKKIQNAPIRVFQGFYDSVILFIKEHFSSLTLDHEYIQTRQLNAHFLDVLELYECTDINECTKLIIEYYNKYSERKLTCESYILSKLVKSDLFFGDDKLCEMIEKIKVLLPNVKEFCEMLIYKKLTENTTTITPQIHLEYLLNAKGIMKEYNMGLLVFVENEIRTKLNSFDKSTQFQMLIKIQQSDKYAKLERYYCENFCNMKKIHSFESLLE